jgi:hypothetical protein
MRCSYEKAEGIPLRSSMQFYHQRLGAWQATSTAPHTCFLMLIKVHVGGPTGRKKKDEIADIAGGVVNEIFAIFGQLGQPEPPCPTLCARAQPATGVLSLLVSLLQYPGTARVRAFQGLLGDTKTMPPCDGESDTE